MSLEPFQGLINYLGLLLVLYFCENINRPHSKIVVGIVILSGQIGIVYVSNIDGVV